MAEPEVKVALLAGATGLTGSCTLEALLAAPDVSRVFAVTRRPLGREHARLANRIVQFEHLETQLKGVSCDVAFCCLGTTIRQAGTPERFRAVDLDCVLSFARAAQAAHVQRFVVISSVGADAHSGNLYLRTKGEMEAGLEQLGFAALDILRPSVLLGARAELRVLEFAAQLLLPLLNPALRGRYADYRGVPARTIAAAMLGAMRSGRRGVQRYGWAGIEALSHVDARSRVPPAAPRPSAGAR